MKTTNFENSKKLAEIGFKAQSNFGYNRAEGDSIKYEVPRGYDNVYYLSYDLETLLDALPPVVNGMPLKMRLDRSPHIGYNSSYEEEKQFVCFQYKNESLADTAARLIVELHEAGIINFNKQKNETKI